MCRVCYTKPMKIPDFSSKYQKAAEKKLQAFGRNKVRNIRLGKKEGNYKTLSVGEAIDAFPTNLQKLRDAWKKKR